MNKLDVMERKAGRLVKGKLRTEGVEGEETAMRETLGSDERHHGKSIGAHFTPYCTKRKLVLYYEERDNQRGEGKIDCESLRGLT